MNARDRILQRLAGAHTQGTRPVPQPEDWYAAHARNESPEQRTARFRTLIEAAHAEVHPVNEDNWIQTLAGILAAKNIDSLLVAPGTAHGIAARDGLAAFGIRCPGYETPASAWKEEFFDSIPASLTTTRGAIAETGSLILWPDEQEPRLMSLVPPVHVALLDASRIHATFFDALRDERWAAGLPTNALLISGPSKTADIQQTMAYGAHGPKELIVLLKGGA